ncbi:hypothetical protein D3C80_2226980 [compost metagenome]
MRFHPTRNLANDELRSWYWNRPDDCSADLEDLFGTLESAFVSGRLAHGADQPPLAV